MRAPASARLLSLLLLVVGGLVAAPPPPAQAAGQLTLSTNHLTFVVDSEYIPDVRFVVVTNTGATTVAFGHPRLAGVDEAHFGIRRGCIPDGSSMSILPPGAYCLVVVEFWPPTQGSKSATLMIPNSAGPDLEVGLSGSTTMGSVIGVGGSGAFGPTGVGDATTRVFTVTNNGNRVLETTEARVSGADAGDFAVVDDACALANDVGPGATCTIEVRFAPTSSGTKAATLTIPSYTGEDATVALSGSTGEPVLDASTASLTFPSTVLGTSRHEPVDVFNSGVGRLDWLGASLSGAGANQFEVNDACAAADWVTTAPCIVRVTFRPTSAGPKSATLVLSAAGQPDRTVTLSGAGATATRVASATPPSLAFGSRTLSTSSAPQTLVVTNTGNSPVVLSQEAFSLGGSHPNDFTVGYDCPEPLDPGEQCTLRVVFRPTATGARNATLLILPGGAVVTVPLSGTGSAATPGIAVSPDTRAFGSVAVGGFSASSIHTVTNTGSVPLSLGSPAISGPSADQFEVVSTTCGATLAATASCTVSARFRPTTVGLKAASLLFPSGAAGSPHTIALTGIATQGYPSLSTSSVDFGATRTGTTRPSQTVTVTNTGTAAMTVGAPVLTGAHPGDFPLVTTTCGGSLAKGATCTTEVRFAPSARGPRSASLQFPNGVNPLTLVQLTGTGLRPVASPDTGVLAFGSSSTTPGGGVPSAPLTLTLSNTGDAALHVGAASVTGTGADQYTLADDRCSGATVAPDHRCTVTVRFDPTTPGAKAATLTLNHDAGPATTATLTGTGIETPLVANPSAHDFGSQPVNAESPSFEFAVSNPSPNVADLTRVELGGADPDSFDLKYSHCLWVVNPSLAQPFSCRVSVYFNPTSVGTKTATLTLEYDGDSSPLVIHLAGTGIAPTAEVSTTALDLGDVRQGEDSEPETVTLTNEGDADLVLADADVTGPDADAFTVDDAACATSLAPGSSCDLAVTFSAGDSGPAHATLSLFHNAADSPATVALTANSMPTSDLKILGVGSLYTGHDRTVTRTVKTTGTLMKYRLGVVNESGAPQSYQLRLTPSGAAATRAVWSTGVGARALPTNGTGNYVTPVIQPGKTGTYELRVTPTDPGQVTATVDVDLLTTEGFRAESVSTQTNTTAPANGTSGYELFAGQGSQPFVGGPVSGQTVTSPALNVGQTTSFRVRLKNNSSTAKQIGLRISPTPGCSGSFAVTVKAGTAVITAAAIAGTYVTPSLAATRYKDIIVSVKRTAVGCGAMRIRADSLDSGAVVRTSYLATNASYNATLD